MFNQQEIDAYRKLSAPSDLRNKVLSSSAFEMPKKRNVNKFVRLTSTIAACLVLVLTVTVFGVMQYGSLDVAVLDSTLPKNSTLTYSMQETPGTPDENQQQKQIPKAAFAYMLDDGGKASIPLTVKGHADISVNSGSVAVMQDACSDEILSEGTTCSVDGETSIRWTVYADEDNHKFEMLICSPFKTEKIILIYQPEDQIWSIERADAE